MTKKEGFYSRRRPNGRADTHLLGIAHEDYITEDVFVMKIFVYKYSFCNSTIFYFMSFYCAIMCTHGRHELLETEDKLETADYTKEGVSLRKEAYTSPLSHDLREELSLRAKSTKE